MADIMLFVIFAMSFQSKILQKNLKPFSWTLLGGGGILIVSRKEEKNSVSSEIEGDHKVVKNFLF